MRKIEKEALRNDLIVKVLDEFKELIKEEQEISNSQLKMIDALSNRVDVLETMIIKLYEEFKTTKRKTK